MSGRALFARRVFTLAPFYGVAALALACIGPIGAAPQYRYGFVGTALAAQWLYWTIGRDPVRYRPLMPVAVLAKLGFALPAAALFVLGRVGGDVLGFGIVDAAIAALFAAAWRRTPTSFL